MNKTNGYLFLVFILLILLIGCSRKQPEGSLAQVGSDIDGSTSNEVLNEEDTIIPDVPDVATIETANQGRNYSRFLVQSLVQELYGGFYIITGDGVSYEINRGAYYPPEHEKNVKLYLESYIYNERQNIVYLEYKYVNTSDLWLYAFHPKLEHGGSWGYWKGTLTTDEGQRINSENSGIPEYIIPPNSYKYFYHRYDNVNSIPEAVEFEIADKPFSTYVYPNLGNNIPSAQPVTKVINLTNETETASALFQVPVKLEPKLDITSLFTSIPVFDDYKLYDHYEDYKKISVAEVSSLTFTEREGEMVITLYPEKYIFSYLIGSASMNFILVTDAGEALPLELVEVNGNQIDNQYPANEPITMRFYIPTIQDKCNSAKLFMSLAVRAEKDLESYYEDGTIGKTKYWNDAHFYDAISDNFMISETLQDDDSKSN